MTVDRVMESCLCGIETDICIFDYHSNLLADGSYYDPLIMEYGDLLVDTVVYHDNMTYIFLSDRGI